MRPGHTGASGVLHTAMMIGLARRGLENGERAPGHATNNAQLRKGMRRLVDKRHGSNGASIQRDAERKRRKRETRIRQTLKIAQILDKQDSA